MKKITLIILASLLSFGAMAQSSPTKGQAPASAKIEKGLANLRNPKAAMDIAAKEDKVVVYHFTGSSWCPPCKMLEADILKSKSFMSFADKNVAYVKMDKDKGGFVDKEYAAEYAKLMSEYKVRGFPTLVLINPKSHKVETIVGYTPLSEITKKIKTLKGAK